MSNLASAIDELKTLDMDGLPAGELGGLLVELTDRITELEAVRVKAVERFHTRREFEADGHLSTVAWLKHRCRMAGSDAGRLVQVAKALRAMPYTREAFQAGTMSLRAAARLVRAATAHPETFVDHEETLVDAAVALSDRDLGRTIAYWRQAADYEHSLADEEHLYRRRRLHISSTFGGMVRIDGDLDPESGEIVATAINALAEPAAKTSDTSSDDRSPAQRRADALVDICRTFLDRGEAPANGGVRPHISVVIDTQALAGNPATRSETTRGTVLHPETVRRLACDATISRVLLDPESQPIDVGRATRTVPAPLRRALIARDRGCAHPACDRPPEWCDAHHIQPWANGGPTNLNNLQLLCRPHHRAAHNKEWEP